MNLIHEGKNPDTIVVTGNTAIDALNTTVTEEYEDEITRWVGDDRLIVLTAHRRENLGEPMYRMFSAIKRIVEKYPDVKVVYPVHLNPIVVKTAEEVFGECERVRLKIRSSSVPASFNVPAVIPSGRSVVSLNTITGFPKDGASS